MSDPTGGPQDAPIEPGPTGPTAAPQGGYLTCPLCHGTSFREETIQAKGEQGYSTHYLDLKICTSCSYTFPFYRLGGSGW